MDTKSKAEMEHDDSTFINTSIPVRCRNNSETSLQTSPNINNRSSSSKCINPNNLIHIDTSNLDTEERTYQAKDCVNEKDSNKNDHQSTKQSEICNNPIVLPSRNNQINVTPVISSEKKASKIISLKRNSSKQVIDKKIKTTLPKCLQTKNEKERPKVTLMSDVGHSSQVERLQKAKNIKPPSLQTPAERQQKTTNIKTSKNRKKERKETDETNTIEKSPDTNKNLSNRENQDLKRKYTTKLPPEKEKEDATPPKKERPSNEIKETEMELSDNNMDLFTALKDL